MSMKRALLPLAAIAELVILLACWIAALIHPKTASRMTAWATRTLPDPSWYRG